ncbi:MAG: hypothetical protein TH68_06600, partial [Candidatus Synechococcus spongiarum 142]
MTVSGMASGVSVDTDGGMDGDQTSLGFRAQWLTSPSNWNEEQTVTLRAAADADTTFDTVTLTHSAAGGEYGAVSQKLVVRVTDDDAPALVLPPMALLIEEGGSATYTVRLAKEPTDGVTVTVGGMGSGVSVDTDAGTEGDQTSLSFTTTDWNTGQTVMVRAAADANTIFETVTLSHTASGGDYGAVSQELMVNVRDDDTASLVLSPAAVTVVEADSATYTVKLATEPTEAVTVT